MNDSTHASDLDTKRRTLLAAIGAATGGAVDEEREAAILDALDEFERSVAREVLDRRSGSALRVVALAEIEQARSNQEGHWNVIYPTD